MQTTLINQNWKALIKPKKLNIQKIFNTNKGINHYKNYLTNNTLFQNEVLFHIYEF